MRKGSNIHFFLLTSLFLLLGGIYGVVATFRGKRASPQRSFYQLSEAASEDFDKTKSWVYDQADTLVAPPSGSLKLHINFKERLANSPDQPANKQGNKGVSSPQPTHGATSQRRSRVRVQEAQEAEEVGFYGWSQAAHQGAGLKDHLYTCAIIDEEQIVRHGAKVRIRLMEDMVIDGVKVPRTTFLSGIMEVHSRHVAIVVQHVKTEKSLLSAFLVVYDQDYHRGIHIAGDVRPSIQEALREDVADEVADEVLDHIPRLAGMARKLFQRRTKKGTTIIVPAGFRILLKQVVDHADR